MFETSRATLKPIYWPVVTWWGQEYKPRASRKTIRFVLSGGGRTCAQYPSRPSCCVFYRIFVSHSSTTFLTLPSALGPGSYFYYSHTAGMTVFAFSRAI